MTDKPLTDLHDEEIRYKDTATGGEKGEKPARFDLIPIVPLWEVARLYGVGAAKYDARNWERGYPWHLSYSAATRHLNLFWSGESIDPETRRHHLAAVIFHAMAMMEYDLKGKGTDDRPNSTTETKVDTTDPDPVPTVRKRKQRPLGFSIPIDEEIG